MHSKIHVNQHRIKANTKQGRRDPVLTIKGYKSDAHRTHASNDYGHEAEIVDETGRVVARVVYRPDCPLDCGAKVWIETDLAVRPVVWESGDDA